MRRVCRGSLSLETLTDLRRRQDLCADVADARLRWKAFRGLAAAQPLVRELERMAGQRSRCFYCSDSRGTDIEHFVAITVDYLHTFVWTNLLWICAGCNRNKGNRVVVTAGKQTIYRSDSGCALAASLPRRLNWHARAEVHGRRP